VVAVVIVVFDEAPDAGLEITRQEVVFQQNTVLKGLVPKPQGARETDGKK